MRALCHKLAVEYNYSISMTNGVAVDYSSCHFTTLSLYECKFEHITFAFDGYVFIFSACSTMYRHMAVYINRKLLLQKNIQ